MTSDFSLKVIFSRKKSESRVSTKSLTESKLLFVASYNLKTGRFSFCKTRNTRGNFPIQLSFTVNSLFGNFIKHLTILNKIRDNNLCTYSFICICF